MKKINVKQEKYDVEETVFTKMLPKIFYRNTHMTYKNMMEKGGYLLVKSLERCYKELGLKSPFDAEDFDFMLHTVEDDQAGNIQFVVVAINPEKADVMNKIILRYGRDHAFMDYKRYLFVMTDDGDLCFGGTPRENTQYSEPTTNEKGYYLFDVIGDAIDKEDEDYDGSYEAFLDDEEERCALGDYSYCSEGWL